MAYEMYKSLTGWKEADSKHRATHMLIGIAEYEKMENNLFWAREERDELRQKVEQVKKEAERNARNEIAKNTQAAQEEVKAISQKLKKEQAERLYQENLNQNLLRVNKERSNEERKLSPKKEHTGYIVLTSQEKEIRYAKGRRTKPKIVWETILQSPYKVDFTEEQARTQIDRELIQKDGAWLLRKLGIHRTQYTEIEDILENSESTEENVAFQKRLKANYQVGYWEVIFLHTKALRPVPKNMRPK